MMAKVDVDHDLLVIAGKLNLNNNFNSYRSHLEVAMEVQDFEYFEVEYFQTIVQLNNTCT